MYGLPGVVWKEQAISLQVLDIFCMLSVEAKHTINLDAIMAITRGHNENSAGISVFFPQELKVQGNSASLSSCGLSYFEIGVMHNLRFN